MTGSGALVWGLALTISLAIGVALATHRRDGKLSLRTLFTDPQPTPPSYVLRELREGGVRVLLRGDVLALFLFYSLLAILAGFAVGMIVIKRIG